MDANLHVSWLDRYDAGVDVKMNVHARGMGMGMWMCANALRRSESGDIRSQPRSECSRQDPVCQISHRHKGVGHNRHQISGEEDI